MKACNQLAEAWILEDKTNWVKDHSFTHYSINFLCTVAIYISREASNCRFRLNEAGFRLNEPNFRLKQPTEHSSVLRFRLNGQIFRLNLY
jgi:hypothetical protein